MAALYKMFSCQGGFNWIYGECTVKNVRLSRWFDLVRHGYGTPPNLLCSQGNKTCNVTFQFQFSLFFVPMNYKRCVELAPTFKSSRGGLEVAQWSDNRLLSASVEVQIPLGA